MDLSFISRFMEINDEIRSWIQELLQERRHREVIQWLTVDWALSQNEF